MGHDSQLRETGSSRLDSWKEIASFLHRDARTVRRWERERGLPVHRVPGGERSGVFAYVGELQGWLHTAVETAATESISSSPEPGSPEPGRPEPSRQEPSRQELSSLADDISSIPSAGPEHLSLSEEDAPVSSPVEPLPSAVSAIHSLNTSETTFVADTVPIEDYVSSTMPAFDPSRTPLEGTPLALARSHIRHYQAATLLLLLTVVAGISAAVVHYRQHKQVAHMVHQPGPEAQDLYLRGRYYWNQRTEDGLNCAVDLFTQAIVNDPKYAAAYAGLADSYLLLRQYGHMPNSEAFPRALAAARQAIALDDSSPEAHRSLAFILRFWNWDMAAAEKEYRRAIELNPNDSQSHHWYATALLSSGRTHEALAQIDIARTLEPQSVSVLADRGLILSLIDVHAGIAALQQVEQADSSFASTHRYLSDAYLQIEDYPNFLAESRKAAELSHNASALPILARAEKTLAVRGPKPMLREMAVSWAPLSDSGSFPAYNTAHFFGLAGDNNQALHYLRLARDRRDPGFLNAEDDAAFAALRSSPEYWNLIEHHDTGTAGNKQPIARLDTPELSE